MKKILSFVSSLGDKLGAVGVIVSALACPFCFPALATIGAALGLGFLSQWEGLFVTVWLPVFAWVVLVSNGLNCFRGRSWYLCLIGMAGPLLLLFSLYYWWNTVLIYVSLTLIICVTVIDLITTKGVSSKKSKCCTTKTKERKHENRTHL